MSEEWSQMEGELMRRGRELVPLEVPLENLVESYFQDGADPISPWEQEPDPPPATADTLLPFEITATPTLLRAEPGLLDETPIAAIEQAAPTVGEWILVAKVVIDAITGAVTARTVTWSSAAMPADTATDYHLLIGGVTVDADPALSLGVQYTYGPINAWVGGGSINKWVVKMV